MDSQPWWMWAICVVMILGLAALTESCKSADRNAQEQKANDLLSLKSTINFWIANAEHIPPPGTEIFLYKEQLSVVIQWDNLELGWFTVKTDSYEDVIFPEKEERLKKTKTRFAGKMIAELTAKTEK